MSFEKIRVALVDDHTIFRRAIKYYLSGLQNDNFSVIHDSADGEQLFEKLPLLAASIDVLVLDLHMPVIGGREIVQFISTWYPTIKPIVLSMSCDFDEISDLLEIGILGYLTKGAELEELPEAIESAHNNMLFENKLLTQVLYWKATGKKIQSNANLKNSFTESELRMLQLIYEEKNTQEIASEIYASISTVEKMKQKLKEKTGAKTTIGLVKFALHHRLLDPPLRENPSS